MPIIANKIKKSDILYQFSNPKKAQQNAYNYLGDDAILYKSTKFNKKYMIYDKNNDKWVHFGSLYPSYEDFLKHNDINRKNRYLRRASNMKGDWKDNPYSSNNLSINLLWS